MDDLDKTIDRIKTDIITSLTNIQLLNDLNTLIEEGNRVVLVNVVLFKSVLREFQLSLSVKLERIIETGQDKENINHVLKLAHLYENNVKDNNGKENLVQAFSLIQEVFESDTVKQNREFRNKIYAHIAKDKTSLAGLVIKYDDYQAVYEKLGASLNLLSGAFFNKSTVLSIVGNDRTVDHFRGLDKAEGALMYIERYEKDDHPALTHIDKLNKRTKD